MRKAAVPSALMISPLLFPLAKDFPRPKTDPAEAKKLLTEAGYPNGFEVTMDCPNDRYVNDEAICQAVTAMLARVGIKINLLAQPKAKYFAKILVSGGYDTSFYLLGWTPGSFDSWNVLANMYRCRDEKGTGGNNNVGNYCNPKMEEMIKQVLVESDTGKRNQLIKGAYELGQNQDWGYVPLHQQALAWGVSKKVKVVQRADNQILFYWFRKEWRRCPPPPPGEGIRASGRVLAAHARPRLDPAFALRLRRGKSRRAFETSKGARDTGVLTDPRARPSREDRAGRHPIKMPSGRKTALSPRRPVGVGVEEGPPPVSAFPTL